MMLGHILLFGSEFCALLDEVAERGRPRFMQFARHRQAALRDDPTASPVSLIMVHDLYCAQVLMDREEPVHFIAKSDSSDKGKPGQLSVAQLGWSDGAIASFSASFLAPEGMGEHGYDRLEVLGDGWSAILTPNPRPIAVWDRRANYPLGLELRIDPPSGMMAEELRRFGAVVRGGELLVGTTFEDALQLQRWIERLHDQRPCDGAI
jgi:predicted dehydrogenase